MPVRVGEASAAVGAGRDELTFPHAPPPPHAPRAPQDIVTPKPFLNSLLNRVVVVRLKWGMEYEGVLVSVDAYMNVQLADTKEFVDGQFAGTLGDVMIRCNNVMYVREARQEEANGETNGSAAS